MQNDECVACPTGQRSPDGSTSSDACVICADKECYQCSETNQCAVCRAGYYLENNECVSCGTGKFSPRGSTSIDACAACDDSDCATCSGSGDQKCTVCKAGFHLTETGYCDGCGGTKYGGGLKCTECTAENLCATCENPYFANSKQQCERCAFGKYSVPSTTKASECKKCSDSNCAICSGPGTGKCTECDNAYIFEDGKCKECAIGQFLKGYGGPYTWEDCTDCPEGCSACSSGTGQYCSNCFADFYLDGYSCLQCPVGYSSPAGVTSASLCYQCADSNCERCSGKGAGKCTRCAENFYWNGSKCVACADDLFSPPGSTSKDACGGCSDSACDYCTGWDYARCPTCKAGYYRTDEKCKSCGEGKSSIVGSRYAFQCYDCEDSDCSLCFNRGARKCSKCKKGFYLTDENTCKLCEVENCKACSSTGGCVTCASGYYVAEDETCNLCEDENCKACSGPNIGRCTSCESGSDLVTGTCQVPAEPLKTNNLVSATIRYDMKMAQFNEEGGKNFFIAKTSRVLGVDIGQVTVSNVRQGSVIVDYEVALSGDNTAAKNMKKAMDKASGDMEFFKNGKVLNYDSNVGPRQKDDEGSGSKVGIIIGVVAGVVAAVCVVVGFVIWKRVAKVKAQKKIDIKYKNNQVVAAAHESVVNEPVGEVIKIEQKSE